LKDRVVGANEYYESTKNKKPLPEGVKGIKVVDDYKIQIELVSSFAGFLNILAMPGCWIFPKEAVDKYGQDMRVKCVGTGPFALKTVKEGEAVIMERNKDYWDRDEFGNQLPYLNTIRFSFIKEKKQELLEFRRGNLDMVFRLPTEMIGEILAEFNEAKEGNIPFELQVTPAMSTQYYGFQHLAEPFNNKLVRLAFNYAIDRKKIVENTLQGDGTPAFYGIVPYNNSFEKQGFAYERVKGYIYDPEKARQLLKEGGYPDGKGFPRITLQINSGGGDRNVLVAQVVQSMLKENLNIEVDIDQMPWAQHLEKLETGKALFWRTAWIADYPDPETFLTLLYSPHIPPNLSDRSYVNSVRYKSIVFDSLYNLAMREVDDKKRFDLYVNADQIGLNEGAIMPIFYDENYRLLQTNVRNFDANAMEYRDMTRVYFVPKEETKKP
jgi:peptide/nickel transport system substrate-binding protein